MALHTCFSLPSMTFLIGPASWEVQCDPPFDEDLLYWLHG